MKIPAGSLVPLAFVAVAAAWAIARADGMGGESPRAPLAVSAGVQAAPSSAAPDPANAPVSPSASPTVAPAESVAPPAPTPTAASSPPAARSPAAPPTDTATATAYPAIPVAPSAADEIAATNTLHQLGKAYLQALIDNDPAPIAAMLASRCSSGNAPAILARRRAEVNAEAGVPIETLVAIAPVVAHLDLPGAEAHTVIQFDARGQRHTLATADGWVLEGGAWRNAEC